MAPFFLEREGPQCMCAPDFSGNKADLEAQRAVSTEEASAYALENGLYYIETSAKTAANVNDLFQVSKQPYEQTLRAVYAFVEGRLSRGVCTTWHLAALHHA